MAVSCIPISDGTVTTNQIMQNSYRGERPYIYDSKTGALSMTLDNGWDSEMKNLKVSKLTVTE